MESASVDWEAWTCSKAVAILSMREPKSFRKRIILTRACLTAQTSISARGNPSPSVSGDSRVELFALRMAAWDSISSSMVPFDVIRVLRWSAGHGLVEVVMVGFGSPAPTGGGLVRGETSRPPANDVYDR